MSTHGNIRIKDAEGGLDVWLHAYSDGHSTEAFRDLKTLPEWLAQRALLSDWQRQKLVRSELEAREWGSLGPWQLSVFAISWCRDERLVMQEAVTGETDLDAIRKELFREAWRCSLGVNLSYCSASTIVGYMVQRHFSRWNILNEADAPWHDVGDDPDFLVECYASEGYYDITPSRDLLRDADAYADDEPAFRFEKCRVNFADDLYTAFEKAGIELAKVFHEESSGDASVSEDE